MLVSMRTTFIAIIFSAGLASSLLAAEIAGRTIPDDGPALGADGGGGDVLGYEMGSGGTEGPTGTGGSSPLGTGGTGGALEARR
jgi:hypothetical protein